MNTKVYLDCTFTVQSGLNTGIQRVVRNIISRHKLAEERFHLQFQPVICILGRYYKIPFEDVLQIRPTIASVGQKGKNVVEKIRKKVQDIFGQGRGLAFALDFLEWVLRKVFFLIKFCRLWWMALGKRQHRAFFEKDDIFVLLDVFWTYDIPKAVTRSNNGAKVVSVIYDLIPVYHSRYVEKVNCRNFSNSLPKLFPIVDQFVCISESVAQDLRRYAKESNLPSRKIAAFRLGSDFQTPSLESQGKISQELASIFLHRRVWLLVGTIEPRKNHGFVLDAFERLWEGGGEERLVILGRVGWMCEEIVQRITSHPLLNKKLYFVRSASDHELEYCYRNAHGLVFASHAEGFGLPLVEAMAKGIRIVCSDIPVFREVGGDYPQYFNLEDVADLVAALRSEKVPSKVEISWPSWDQSVCELVKYF